MSSRVTSASDPAYATAAVTPNDDNDLVTKATGGLFVTAVGNVAFHDMSGNVVTLTAVAANTRIPIQARRVLSTGTTATVIALFA